MSDFVLPVPARPFRSLATVATLIASFAGLLSTASADPLPDRIRVATWNLEWFYDDRTADNETDLARELSSPSAEAWQWKVDVAAAGIAKLDATIVALQEVENRKVLRDLTKTLKEKHGQTFRIAFAEGWDVFTEQDVAIIFREGLVEFSRREQSREMFDTQDYYNLQKHLFARFEWGQGDEIQSLTMLTLHLRAAANGASIRERQCRLAKAWLADALAKPGANVIVLGDVNTSEQTLPPTPGSDVDILSGRLTPQTEDDLFDLHAKLPVEERPTHLNGDAYDRIFVSRDLLLDGPGKDLVFRSIERVRDGSVRGAPDTEHRDVYWQIAEPERDASDHYPLVAEFDVK